MNRSYRDFLTEEGPGVLRFGGARMALLDIEAGFWGLRRQIKALRLGFEPQQEYPGHMGLQSMQERLLKVQGSLAVQSKPGDGTRIRARIPVH